MEVNICECIEKYLHGHTPIVSTVYLSGAEKIRGGE